MQYRQTVSFNRLDKITKTANQIMEVHHHPEIHHERKKFKEYFLEFLMIFLAVTMGFFAETIREGISEHGRAKEFASSMIKDLEEDTIQLKGYSTYFNYAANKLDTFMS